jgi:hypothetical protein
MSRSKVDIKKLLLLLFKTVFYRLFFVYGLCGSENPRGMESHSLSLFISVEGICCRMMLIIKYCSNVSADRHLSGRIGGQWGDTGR